MTRLLDADATSRHVGRLVHLDTQRADVGLDLTVGGARCHLKENCRLSRLLVTEGS